MADDAVKRDERLREGLVQALLICQTEAALHDKKTGRVALILCGQILDRWDELIKKEKDSAKSQ